MSKENVADYTPIPTFETADTNGKETVDSPEQQAPNRRFRRIHFTRRDCLIVLVVVCLALAAISVSLIYGLPALEAKRLAMMNGTTTEVPETDAITLNVTASS